MYNYQNVVQRGIVMYKFNIMGTSCRYNIPSSNVYNNSGKDYSAITFIRYYENLYTLLFSLSSFFDKIGSSFDQFCYIGFNGLRSPWRKFSTQVGDFVAFDTRCKYATYE